MGSVVRQAAATQRNQLAREPKRIAIVAHYAPTIVSFRGALIRALVQNGAQVWVLVPDYTSEIRNQIRQLGAVPVDYPLDRTGTNPFKDIHSLYHLIRLMSHIRPDVVFSYGVKPIIYANFAAWCMQTPKRIAYISGLGYSFATRDNISFGRWGLRRVIRTLYCLAMQRSSVACFQNIDDLEEMARLGIVPPQKAILVGPTGVDLSEWFPTPPVLSPITFTLAARLLREKGIIEFAQAAQRIKNRYPNTRFLLLGGLDTNPGTLREHEVRQWVDAGILEWFGHVPDVRPYFAQTSVYVLPSYYREGVPRSTQEAMAMARPVITTDAPGCRETVVDGVNGFLVPPRDVDALVAAMERFIVQPELIVEMGQASRKLAEERFDVHKINQRLLQIIGVSSACSAVSNRLATNDQVRVSASEQETRAEEDAGNQLLLQDFVPNCSKRKHSQQACIIEATAQSRQSPRIVVIAHYAPSILNFRGALIRTLVQNGADVFALAPDYTPEFKKAVCQLGAYPVDYPMQRTGMNPLMDIRTLFALRRLLHQLQPDIVFPYSIKPVIYGLLAARGSARRVALIEGTGYTFTATPSDARKLPLRFVVTCLYRIALRRAHAVLFLNPDDQREFCELALVSCDKAVLIRGIGVDLSEFSPQPPALSPICFTLAARLLREKGIVEFAQAAQRIKQRYPSTRFLLLGGTDTNPGTLRESEVRQWAEAGILEWHGHVPDVRPYFAQTSVYVLPSYREGVPRSTQEAMAMARPVITTDAPGCRETVIDGVNGFLVPPRDVDALVRAMERFVQQPELIVEMGQASRKLAEERFDVHKINQRILEVMGIKPTDSPSK
jgi:glycosyltransferase involved in cell wall biosynthesis